MYVLVDRQAMAIVHKHRDREVLNNLAWIECTNSAATVPLGNVSHWAREFSPLELAKIYNHATGAELKGYGTALAAAVHAMALRLPETDAVLEETRLQRAYVLDGDKSCYQYVKGAVRPMSHTGLFEPDALTCARVEAEEIAAAASAPKYTAPPSAGGVPGVPAAPGAPQAPRAPSEPRTGGTRATIFEVADRMWEAAGSPRDNSTVLGLRKQMMVELEVAYQIKKTTSSTALGDWMKQRLG